MPKVSNGIGGFRWQPNFMNYTTEQLAEYHQEELGSCIFDKLIDKFWWEGNWNKCPTNLPPLPAFLETIYDPDMQYDGAIVHLCFSHIVHAAQLYPTESVATINFFNRVSHNFFNNVIVEAATFKMYDYVHRCRLMGFITNLQELNDTLYKLASWFKYHQGCCGSNQHLTFLEALSIRLGMGEGTDRNKWRLGIEAWENVEHFNTFMVSTRPYEMQLYRQRHDHHLPVHLRQNYGETFNPNVLVSTDIMSAPDSRTFIARFALNFTHQNPTTKKFATIEETLRYVRIKDESVIANEIAWFNQNEDMVLWEHEMLINRLPEPRDHNFRHSHFINCRKTGVGKTGEDVHQSEQRRNVRQQEYNWLVQNEPQSLMVASEYSQEVQQSRLKCIKELQILRLEQPELSNWVDKNIPAMALAMSDWKIIFSQCQIDNLEFTHLNNFVYYPLRMEQAPNEDWRARNFTDYSPKGQHFAPTLISPSTNKGYNMTTQAQNQFTQRYPTHPVSNPNMTPRGYQAPVHHPQHAQRPQQPPQHPQHAPYGHQHVPQHNGYPHPYQVQANASNSFPLLIGMTDDMQPILCHPGDADYDYHYANGASEFDVASVARDQRNKDYMRAGNMPPQTPVQHRAPQEEVLPPQESSMVNPRIKALREEAERMRIQKQERDSAYVPSPQETSYDFHKAETPVEPQPEMPKQTPNMQAQAPHQEKVVLENKGQTTESQVKHMNTRRVNHRVYETRNVISEYDMINDRDVSIQTEVPRLFLQAELIEKHMGLTIAQAETKLLTINLPEESANPQTGERVVYLIPECVAEEYNIRPQISPDGDIGNVLYNKYRSVHYYYFNAYGDVRDTAIDFGGTTATGEDMEQYDAHQCNPNWMHNREVMPDYFELECYGDGTTGVQHPFVKNDDLLIDKNIQADPNELYFAETIEGASALARARLNNVRHGINDRLALEYQFIQTRPFHIDTSLYNADDLKTMVNVLSHKSRIEIRSVQKISEILDINCPLPADAKVAFNQYATERLNRMLQKNLQLDVAIDDAAQYITELPQYLEDNYGSFVSSAFQTNLYRYVNDLRIFLEGDRLKDYQISIGLLPIENVQLEAAQNKEFEDAILEGVTPIVDDEDHPLHDDLVSSETEKQAVSEEEALEEIKLPSDEEIENELRGNIIAMGEVIHVTELPFTSEAMGLVINDTHGSLIRNDHEMYKTVQAIRQRSELVKPNRTFLRTKDNVKYEILLNYYAPTDSYVLAKV